MQDLQVDSAAIHGPVLTHTEVFSIGGLLPLPETGLFTHYPPHQRFPHGRSTMPPSTVLGISDHHTFRIIGTTAPNVSETLVREARLAVVGVRRSSAVLVGLLVQKAATEARIDLLARGSASTDRDEMTKLGTTLVELETAISASETALAAANQAFAEKTATPGIIVAEWTIQSQRRGGIQAAPVFGVSGSRSMERSGLVILGGLRVSHLYPGDDLKDVFINLQAEDRAAVQYAGLTTYMLQARFVHYLSNFNLEQWLSANVELQARDLVSSAQLLARLDRVKINIALASAAALSSAGSVGDMQWDVKQVAVGRDVDGLGIDDADGWHTVQAVVTMGDLLFKHWLSKIPAGAHVSIQLLSAPQGGHEDAIAALEALNDRLGWLRATLLTDRSYLAKDQLKRALEEISEATVAANKALNDRPLAESDAVLFQKAAEAVRISLDAIHVSESGFEWSRVANRSQEMVVVMKSLHDACHWLSQLTHQSARTDE